MLNLFSMIVTAVEFLFAFFSKFSFFASSSAALSNLRFGIRVTFLTLFYTSFVLYVTVLLAFFYYATTSIVTLFNLVSNIILTISNYQGGSGLTSNMLSGFYYFLNVSGIATGISAAFPFVASAILFRLTIFLYRTTLYFYRHVTYIYVEVVKLITSA